MRKHATFLVLALLAGDVCAAAEPRLPRAAGAEMEERSTAAVPDPAAPHAPAPVTFGDFRESLSAYGTWERSPRYGWVWRPRVDASWRPYYYGRWVWTDDGWYWSSDEPWSWATYHYGRWAYDPDGGWMWLPGYDWAPAWVTWRYGVGVIGWAPLGPFAIGVVGSPIYFAWTFVPADRFHGFAVDRYALAPGIVDGLWPRTVSSAAPARSGGSRPSSFAPYTPVPRPGPGAILRSDSRQ